MTAEHQQVLIDGQYECLPVASDDSLTPSSVQPRYRHYNSRLTSRGGELLLEEHASNHWSRKTVTEAVSGGDFDVWLTDVDARSLLEALDALHIPDSFEPASTMAGPKLRVAMVGGDLVFSRYNLVFATRPRSIPPRDYQDIAALLATAKTLGTSTSRTLSRWVEWAARHLATGGPSRSSKLVVIDKAGTSWIVRSDMILAMEGVPHLRNVAFDSGQLAALADVLRSSNRQIRIASSGDETRDNWLVAFIEEGGINAFVAAPAVLKPPETIASFHELISRATHEFILDVGLLQATLPALSCATSRSKPQITMEVSGELTEESADCARPAIASFSAPGNKSAGQAAIRIVLRRASTRISFDLHPVSLLRASHALGSLRVHAYYVQGTNDLLLQSAPGAESSGKSCLLRVSATGSPTGVTHA